MREPSALPGVGIVYFGNDWFAENRTSSHHIAMRLARHVPVLYVDSPGIRPPKASSGRDLKRGVRKIVAALRRPVSLGNGLWHCTVPQVPFRRIPGVGAFNRIFSQWAVRRALRIVGIRRRISWFVVPHPGFLAGHLGEEFCVYYCTDDYAAFPGVDVPLITQRDLDLSRRADLVFVATPALFEPKRALNASTVFSPHGVDVDLFRRAIDPATRLPDAIADLRGPVVGYIGTIHDWVDLDLIAWLAGQRPHWTFLLVGHAATDVGMLRALPNVRLAGPQPYPELPRWSKAFDVAVIPQRRNRWIANANPLKLREYLAAGKPVVSVRNPEIEKYARWVRIADDRDEFLAALDAAMQDNAPGAAEDRIAAVADQTWERRVDDVLDAVASAFASKQRKETAGIHEQPAIR